MNRLHHQDLRAIMAAIITTQDYKPYREPGCEERIVTDTDCLLAELERTAKPDPAKVKNPCAGIEVDVVDMARLRMDQIVKAQEAAMIQAIKNEGANAERERIIGILIFHGFGTHWTVEKLRAALEPK